MFHVCVIDACVHPCVTVSATHFEVHKRVVQNCHHFHERTQRMLGGGVNGHCKLFLMSFMVHCNFEEGVSKSTFSNVGKGVPRKEYSVYTLENSDNYGRPLRCNCIVFQMLDEGHAQPPVHIGYVYQWLLSAIKKFKSHW